MLNKCLTLMRTDLFNKVFVSIFLKGFGALSLLGVNYILSKKYGLDTVADFALLITSLSLSAFISKVGLDVYSVKYITRAMIVDRVKISSTIITLSIFFSGITTLLFSFYNDSFLFLFSVFFFGLFSVIPEVIRGHDHVMLYAFIRNFFLNFLILLTLVFCFFTTDTVDVTMLYSICVFTSLLVTIFIANKASVKLKLKISSIEIYKSVIKESFFMQISSICIYFLGAFSVLLLSFFNSKDDVGIYFICFQLALVFNMITTSVSILYSNYFSKYYHENNISAFKKKYIESAIINAGFLLIPLAVYIFYGDFLLSRIFSITEDSASYVLVLLATSYYLRGALGPSFAALNMSGNHDKLMKLMISFGVIGLIVNCVIGMYLPIVYFATSVAIINISLTFSSFYMVKKKVFSLI